MKYNIRHYTGKWRGEPRFVKGLFAFLTIVVLSSCGRGNYNGTYQGTIAPSSADGQTTASNGNTGFVNNGAFAQATFATLTLSQNRRTVQGNISAGGVQGFITANALQRGTLDEVTLNLTDPMTAQSWGNGNTGGQNLNYNYSPFSQYCVGLFRGRLSTVSNGVRLSGILVSQGALTGNVYNQWNTTYCPAITLDVTRR